ncbi:hypothetical protein LQZ21_09680 [Treponema sp. TIM-1]|uniref:hypothetical protein n=1 Tax=Treponema sp. TIM-1 TaxID=2898417 RepID=UPI00397F145D
MKKCIIVFCVLLVFVSVDSFADRTNTRDGVTLDYWPGNQADYQPTLSFAARNDNDFDVVVYIDVYYRGKSEPQHTLVSVAAKARAKPCVISSLPGYVTSVRITSVRKSEGL